VLKLLLRPAALQPEFAAAAGAVPAVGQQHAAPQPQQQQTGPQQQQQQGQTGPQQQQQRGVCVVGTGKSSSVMWLMQADVTPWSDDDSLFALVSKGAAIQQQQQQDTQA
jgi:hypothetical protein